MAYQSITETDRYLFGKGTHYEIYEKLGAHPAVSRNRHGISFAVWAPHAVSVSVIGDFNDWDPKKAPMKQLADSGIWETFVSNAKEGDLYKFYITSQSGEHFAKADPYAFASELRPKTASRICDLSGYLWQDQKWMDKRSKKKPIVEPYAIYEVQLGSWRRNPSDGNFLSYRELAESLSVYVKEMGYTHVELIGIAEYPFDGSWGYQVTGYYAPTSRYGAPKDFMYFVDYLHQQNIGVILDWVPAHFPKDAHGLSNFDGQPLYEYADPKKGEHPDWGTKIFNYECTEVSNFLIANALYWLEKYHVDGLRVDAVASMLYLDYGKQDGQWVPNQYGENKNLEAIEFFRHLNSIVRLRAPGAITIAEESTAWPGVTAAPETGGLGFTFKWNMGWMHDFLSYMKEDPLFRKYHHHQMTFGMTYAHSENFILVLSHDEVVHLKRSMLEKMPGEDADKFANLKAGYTFLIGHPGKKLLFMGQEFGQRREWSEERELDWFLLEDPKHQNLQRFFRGLLHLYRTHPALYRKDQEWDGFQWINCNDAERSIFSFVRYSPTGKKHLLFICSFTPVERTDYRVGVPCPGTYTLLLDQTTGLYGRGKKKPVQHAVLSECDGQEYSIDHPLAPYGVAVYEFSTKTDAPRKR
ncbi:1,4-alpha-glucan branching protein GlgB [Hominifimenecus sp. rT4P-3]|uniref:1,4-alpha-glucan branching protein GlgB n=1 Tax=Hominifimenecus sp. rT4P-3 TaxID=3242979 RepID=UPI003DA3215C